MAMTVATSRSAALSTIPSATTRQPSFTTGKNRNSMMSCSTSNSNNSRDRGGECRAQLGQQHHRTKLLAALLMLTISTSAAIIYAIHPSLRYSAGWHGRANLQRQSDTHTQLHAIPTDTKLISRARKALAAVGCLIQAMRRNPGSSGPTACTAHVPVVTSWVACLQTPCPTSQLTALTA